MNGMAMLVTSCLNPYLNILVIAPVAVLCAAHIRCTVTLACGGDADTPGSGNPPREKKGNNSYNGPSKGGKPWANSTAPWEHDLCLFTISFKFNCNTWVIIVLTG